MVQRKTKSISDTIYTNQQLMVTIVFPKVKCKKNNGIVW